MSTQLKFTPITDPIKDTITGVQINNGYQLIIPFELFQQYKFNAKMKLDCPTCDFIKTPIMLHAWIITQTGKMAKKETHIELSNWSEIIKQEPMNKIEWPTIQQSEIEKFNYDVLLVVQPLVDSDMHEVFLKISNEQVQYKSVIDELLEEEISEEFKLALLQMGNGFIVDIINTTNEDQEIKLFTGPIPAGVIVRTMDERYDFDGLQMAAQVKKFNGNTITTGSIAGVQIEIMRNGVSEKTILNGRYEGPEIIIDGQNDYVKLLSPANTKFYIRLLSIPREMM